MKEKVLYKVKDIDTGLDALSKELTNYILSLPEEEQNKIIFIGLLVGSIHFVSDLTRKIYLDHKLSFIKATSYLNNKQTELSFDLNGIDISGHHIILLDDICDTGITLNKIVEKIKTLKPLSIKTCVLLNKKLEIKHHKPDFKVFDVEDLFVYGYGMDYSDYKRNLPDIRVKIQEK